MTTKIHSLFRGALASAIFALLAVSVSENAGAQTVAHCPPGSNTEIDPHDDTNPHIVNSACRSTPSSSAFIVTDPSSSLNCGRCDQGLTCTQTEYSFLVDGVSFVFCGPESQCNAVGGTLSVGGTVCECDSGNERINGVCVPRCGTGEVRKNGVCVAISTLCEGNVGIPITNPADRFDPHFTGISNTNPCHPDAPGVSPEQRLSLYIFTDQDFIQCRVCNVRGGINFENRDACDLPNIIYVHENFRFCGPSDQCTAVSGTVENGDCSGCSEGFDRVNGRCVQECLETHERNSDEECAARAASDCPDDHEFRAESANPADGGVCEECETYESSTGGAECLTAAAADCPNNFEFAVTSGTSGTCTACLTNEVSTGGNACECNAPYYEAPSECRLPAENSECASVYTDGSAPIFNEDEPTNCRALDGPDCPTGQVLLSGASACSACTAPLTPNAERNACECADPNVEAGGECRLPAENAECARVGDGSAPIFDENEPTNCRAIETGADCPTDQVLLAGAAACTACTGLLTPNTARNACECADPNVEVNGECQAEVSSCPDAHHRPVNNVCTECDTDQHLVNGACVACPDNAVRATGDAACVCNPPNVEVGEECRAEPTCAGNLTPNAQNECHCNPQTHFGDIDSCVDFLDCADPLDLNEDDNMCFCPDTHFGDADSCVPHARCTGDNVIRDADTNDCVCADNSEGTPETACTACTGGKTSQGGADCACPTNLSFEDPETGVCEASLEGTCTEPRTLYNSATNACDCPAGQRPTADETACEAIPAASSGGGGSSGGGAAAAIIAVPVVLIGGYWLLGGFGYVDPVYDFNYSGENGSFEWDGTAGFNLHHGGLRSYASAVQHNGDAVEYRSGISFEKDYLSLTYDGAESDSEYLYDLGASLKAEFGLFTISPTAGAEFQYNQADGEWASDSSAAVEAAWTAHRWNVRAQSEFSGGAELDVEFLF